MATMDERRTEARRQAEPKPGLEQVRGLKHLQRLLPLLERLHEVGCGRDKAGNRTLFFDDYVKLVLLYLLNPLINSMNTLLRAAELPRVRKALKIRRFSAGSFSESVRVFQPQCLQQVIAELARELRPLPQDPRFADLKAALTLVDSTVLSGLPRLAAAANMDTRHTTGRNGRGVYGWRLHTQLDLELFLPRRVDSTGARNAGGQRENRVLMQHLEAERCYVGDGGHADAALLDAIVEIHSCYVIRLRENSVFEDVQERELSQAALDAGVVRDAVVRWSGARHPVRLVQVQVAPHPHRSRNRHWQSDTILIATNLLDLPAELIALIYRQRYTVELFFRFLKQLLGLRHLLSHRREGADIQVYCAVIACLLIHLQTGRRPDKRLMEMMTWYLLGLASDEDVVAFLNKPDRTGIKKAQKAALWAKLGVH
jgi:hypothetical protein